MNVASVGYLVAALVGCSFFHYLPGPAAKRGALALVNLLVLSLLLPNLASWGTMLVFLGSGYVAAVCLAVRPSKWIFGTCVAALVAGFVVLKRYAILPEPLLIGSSIQIVGLSYMLFRQIHFVVDTMQGAIVKPDAYTYANYQLNFMGLLAGPIQRYQDFAGYFRSPTPTLGDRYEVLRAVERILIGTVKVAFLGSLCLGQYTEAFERLQEGASGEIAMTRAWAIKNYAVMFYMYPAYMYSDFSGYCDIVIGTGSLLGLRIPENFDRPWRSRNMIEFWTRQHITLGFWIRDYLFTPMYKAAAERLGTRAASHAFLFYFVALFLAGVWHGSTMNFVVFGLLHGAGVSATKAWENFLLRRVGRKGLRTYLGRRDIRAVAVLLTFHFVAFAFMFFTPDLERWWVVTKAVARTLLGMEA